MSKIYMKHTPSVREANTTVSVESEDGSTEVVIHGLESVDENMHALTALSERDADAALASLESELLSHSKLFDNASRVFGALRSAQGPLTHHQASMMAMAAQNAGIQLSHSKHGMGLEAYTGERHVVHLKASLESVGEWIMKWLDKLAELWERFTNWLVKVLDPALNATRVINAGVKNRYDNYTPEQFAALKAKIDGGDHKTIRKIFDAFYGDESTIHVGNRITTLVKFFNDLGASYGDRVSASTKAAINSAKELSKLKGNQWRKDDLMMSKVKEFQFPVPEGFTKTADSSEGALAHYQSPRLPGHLVVTLICPEAGSHRGHRGAKAYLDAFKHVQTTMGGANLAPPKDLEINITLQDVHNLSKLTQAAISASKLVTSANYLSAEARQAIRSIKADLASSEIDEAGASVIRDLLEAARGLTKAGAVIGGSVRSMSMLASVFGTGIEAQ